MLKALRVVWYIVLAGAGFAAVAAGLSAGVSFLIAIVALSLLAVDNWYRSTERGDQDA